MKRCYKDLYKRITKNQSKTMNIMKYQNITISIANY